MIIAIDGKVATGKSSVAKEVARRLAFIYFDTGAMYRSFTWGVLDQKIDPQDIEGLKKYLASFEFDIRIINGEKRYFVMGKDVSEAIRQPRVTGLVSEVSAYPFVREKLVEIQREWAKGVNAVFEGRDIGTVVFPDADLKIFLTASPEIRAKRRLEEWQVKYPEQAESYTLDKMIEEVNKRDSMDSTRETSPLKRAENAIEIDTSTMTIDDVVSKIVSLSV